MILRCTFDSKNCIFASNKTRLALSTSFLNLRVDFGKVWVRVRHGNQNSIVHNEILGKRERNFRNKIYSILVMFVRICSRTRNITSLHDSVNESTESFSTIFSICSLKTEMATWTKKRWKFRKCGNPSFSTFYGFSSGQMANSIMANSFNLHTRLLDIKYRIEKPQTVFSTICIHFTGNFRW